MATYLINVYKDNPTAGAKDGTKVSNDYTNPIHFDLNAAENESQIIPLAVRCDDGYHTVPPTTLTDYNDTKDRYQLSLDGVTWSDSITFASGIGSTNVLFYAKARSTSTDHGQLDRSAKFLIDCELERD